MEKKWRITGLVDCHCHLTDARVAPELSGMLGRAEALGIKSFIAGGMDPSDWQAQSELAKKINLLPCFGLHPYWISNATPGEFELAFKRLEAELPKAFALGEIGLDFRPEIAKGHENWQRECFHRQWELAIRARKVAVLHLVRAHEEKLPDAALSRGALVHAFNAGIPAAKKYLDLGFCLSIGGSVLRKNNQALHDAVCYAPLSQLLIESDTPDQAPPEFKKRLNEPATILLVAERVAALKGVTADEVLQSVQSNLQALFFEELA